MLESIRNKSQSLVVKIAFGVIIVVFVFWGIGSYTSSPGVVAKVNGLPITEQDFLNQYNQQVERLRASYPEITPEELKQMNFPYSVLQSLVLQTLIVDAAKKAGLEISPRDMYEVISTFPFALDANGKFDVNLYTQGLQNSGQNVQEFERMLEEDMMDAKFQEFFSAAAALPETQAKKMFEWQAEKYGFNAVYFTDATFIDSVNPTEEEIKAEYEKNISHYAVPAQYRLNLLEITPNSIAETITVTDEQVESEYNANRDKYAVPEKVDAAHILLPLAENAPQEEVDKVLAQVKEIQDKLAAGEDFGTLAEQYSADTFSAQSKGNLGFFARGQMVQPFEDVAFATEIGQVSEPVRTRFGYHLIKVNDKTQAHMPTLEDVKEDIRTSLALTQAFGSMQGMLDVFLLAGTQGASLKDTAEKQGFTNLKETQPLALDAISFQYQIDDVTAIAANAPGKIFSMPMASNEGVYVAEVLEVKEPTTKSLEELHDAIATTLKEQQAHALAYAKAMEVNSDLEKSGNAALEDETLIENLNITRNGVLSEYGDNLLLAETLFAQTENGKWLPEAYEVNGGYILVQPTEKIPAEEILWEAQKNAILQQLMFSRQNMLYSIFVQELTKNAKIEIINEAYFQ